MNTSEPANFNIETKGCPLNKDKYLTKGLPASPGAAVGRIVLPKQRLQPLWLLFALDSCRKRVRVAPLRWSCTDAQSLFLRLLRPQNCG